MQRLQVLLFHALCRHKPHVRTPHRFANGFRVVSVVPFDRLRTGLLPLTQGFTNRGAISLTSCPSFASSRAQ